MTEGNLYPALQMRLASVEAEITRARRAAAQSHGTAHAEAEARLADLEHRHATLAERLRGLAGHPPSAWQSIKAEFDLMADDLATAIEDFTAWATTGHTAHGSRHSP